MSNTAIQNADFQLIEGIAKNDIPTIKKIYDLHLSGIIALVKRNKGNVEDAKDVFQEAILVIYDKASQPGFELKSSFYSFLYGISRFIWLRQLKKKHRQTITIEGDEGYIDETEIEKLVEEEEKWRLFHETFDKLGDECQKVLRLFFDGEPMKAIAAKLSLSANYVKIKKHRCKEQFSKMMKADARYMELI